jgi:hypothetical protein
MTPDLIPITNYPTMPSPFTVSDEGEAWTWGDFVLVLQSNPITLSEGLSKLANELGRTKLGKAFEKPPIEYPFAMSVYYRMDKNPHGPSRRPVMVVTLEKADYQKILAKMREMGADTSSINIPSDSPLMLGLFDATKRKNLGNYLGDDSREAVSETFFQIIGSELALNGEPNRIGVIKDIYGHPDTGWPIEKSSTSSATTENKKGCLSVVAIGGLMAASILVFLIQKI